MTCNIGTTERGVRIASAGALTTAAFMTHNRKARFALFGLAAISAATAASRYCPLNQALQRGCC